MSYDFPVNGLVEEDTDVPCFMKLSKMFFLENVDLTVRKYQVK